MQKTMFPDMPEAPKPEDVQPGTRWRHHSGKYYRVLMLTNEHSQQEDKFPLTAVYMDEQQRTWSRPVSKFVRKFTPISG